MTSVSHSVLASLGSFDFQAVFAAQALLAEATVEHVPQLRAEQLKPFSTGEHAPVEQKLGRANIGRYPTEYEDVEHPTGPQPVAPQLDDTRYVGAAGIE